MSVENSRLSFALLLAMALLWRGGEAQQFLGNRMPITMDADRSELDLRQNRSIFYGLRITQGATRIEAERAETSAGTDFTDSRWRFAGDVRIDVGETRIRGGSADLHFVNHELVSARVAGSPATFTDTDQRSGRRTSGAAESFYYELAAGRVTFEGNARIEDGENEVSGSALVYAVEEQRVLFEGDEDSGEKVRITITPPDSQALDEARESGEQPEP